MSNDLNNILPEDDKEKLLRELNDDLFGDDNDLDQQFEIEAKQGLQNIDNKKANEIVNSLNADLSRHLSKKKKRRGILKDPSNIYITIITILLLIVIAFIVIKYSLP